METQVEFTNIWNRIEEFSLPDQEFNLCEYAKTFLEWVEVLCGERTEPNVVSINQAKILLQDKYFAWRKAVPQRHRDKIRPTGHVCIFQVYEQAYEQLEAMELALFPPMLFIPPPPPPPPPPPQITGLFLGEVDE